MTSMTPAFAVDGDLAEGDAPPRSLSTRLAIAFIALLTAWMVGGVRATPAFADDDGWGDQRTSGDHRDGDHRDGDRTARSGDWSDHQRDGDARSGDHRRSDWQQRIEAGKRLAAKRAAAKTSSTAVHTTTTSHRVKAAAVSHAKSQVVAHASATGAEHAALGTPASRSQQPPKSHHTPKPKQRHHNDAVLPAQVRFGPSDEDDV